MMIGLNLSFQGSIAECLANKVDSFDMPLLGFKSAYYKLQLASSHPTATDSCIMEQGHHGSWNVAGKVNQ
jgi:hypothetical protein